MLIVDAVRSAESVVSRARGVSQINHGLPSLEESFEFLLPERQDELGTISRSINKMARARRKLEADVEYHPAREALDHLKLPVWPSWSSH